MSLVYLPPTRTHVYSTEIAHFKDLLGQPDSVFV